MFDQNDWGNSQSLTEHAIGVTDNVDNACLQIGHGRQLFWAQQVVCSSSSASKH